jgi:hypothetical protein
MNPLVFEASEQLISIDVKSNWSNLESWQDFGAELASEGKDVWLVEITGGPEQDCPTCPNYNYDDLVDYYWPALIGGVQEYSDKDTIDYVGFSNGCRVALSSLEDHADGESNVGYYYNFNTGQYEYSDLSADPVSTFVGVGCPGAFEGGSLFGECLNIYGDRMQELLSEKDIEHPTIGDIGSTLMRVSDIFSCDFLGFYLKSSSSDGPISTNLTENYHSWIVSPNDSQPGNNVNLDAFRIYWGLNGYQNDNDNDYIVTQDDILAINSTINSIDKDGSPFHLRHSDLPKIQEVRNTIMEDLR